MCSFPSLCVSSALMLNKAFLHYYTDKAIYHFFSYTNLDLKGFVVYLGFLILPNLVGCVLNNQIDCAVPFK